MFSIEFAPTLKEVFHDHESYRRGWKNMDDVMQPSKFLQSWSARERLVADFISAACFNNDEAYNSALVTGIRHRRSTEELLSHSIFQDNWQNICSLHQEQKKKEAAEEVSKRQKAKADANEAAGQAGEDKKDEKATGEDKKDDKKVMRTKKILRKIIGNIIQSKRFSRPSSLYKILWSETFSLLK